MALSVLGDYPTYWILALGAVLAAILTARLRIGGVGLRPVWLGVFIAASLYVSYHGTTGISAYPFSPWQHYTHDPEDARDFRTMALRDADGIELHMDQRVMPTVFYSFAPGGLTLQLGLCEDDGGVFRSYVLERANRYADEIRAGGHGLLRTLRLEYRRHRARKWTVEDVNAVGEFVDLAFYQHGISYSDDRRTYSLESHLITPDSRGC